MRKVLVTGGKGFIGSHLARRLTAIGDEVSSFDMSDAQDIRDLWAVMKAVKDKDAVFHLAAIADLNWARVHPVETMKINIEGTRNIAEACRFHGTPLYYASTCCVYGNQEQHPVTEETLPNPSEIYACSKLAGENVVTGFHHTYGLKYNLMRFATIYGEGTRPALGTHIFMGQALRGEPITVHGDGSQTRTLTHVDDLIDAITALYQSGKVNGTWNMTTEEEVSALQMAQDIKRISGSDSEIAFIPQRVGQTQRESVSAEKMSREVEWRAQVSWDEGITRMFKWFLATKQIDNRYVVPEWEV